MSRFLTRKGGYSGNLSDRTKKSHLVHFPPSHLAQKRIKKSHDINSALCPHNVKSKQLCFTSWDMCQNKLQCTGWLKHLYKHRGKAREQTHTPLLSDLRSHPWRYHRVWRKGEVSAWRNFVASELVSKNFSNIWKVMRSFERLSVREGRG